ncbi:macro domain-containing protein [Bacillus cereus]|uniref:macro domain-containing protein n=1 Tax=Bacillus cereus TaxID=1396 RepID=UPI000BFA5F4D|nr:macro domain-containing protein [Bacillus cereus]PEV24324.1 hypothetical protein CN419_26685 [Bacillus cereus]GCF83116.1 hypothetical protein BCACH14_50920 [Bacillus cereus]HDR8167975.1 macro domain-containing protein [Bacillus cereus]
MLKFVSGDFFDYDADIRINTVNCVGVMGKGVALVFKKKFPGMFIDYRNACNRNEVKPGKPHVWKDENLFSSCTIINFPTKVDWRNPSEYEYIEEGLIWLRQYLLEKENSTVTLPALGCGHGGLDWNKVKIMINKYLSDLNAQILVFEPSSSTRTSNFKLDDIQLKDQNIQRLLPNDGYYPPKLIGHSTPEIYCKGNTKLLHKKNIAIVANYKSSDREKNALLKVINELPVGEFAFTLGWGSSYEKDLAKEILSKGFDVILVIPFGILQLKVRKDLVSLWNYDKIAVLSTTKPNQEWKNYESINSLKLRMKLGNIIVFNSLNLEYMVKFEKEIDELDREFFYINYWDNEIDFLKNKKLQKIGISPVTKKPNIFPLLNSLIEI